MASLSNPFDALLGDASNRPSANNRFSNPISTVGTSGVTSGFGKRSSPMGIGSRNHGGIDLASRGAGSGYAAEAAAGGVVSFAGRAGGYGNMVEVTHEDGSKTRYGHLDSLNVRVGDTIARGQPVGKVGSTGRSTGPHLHFEVIDPSGKRIDPRKVTDLTNRSLSVTPTPRPGTATDLMALSPVSVSAPASVVDINPDRFGALTSPSFSPRSISTPVSPMGSYADIMSGTRTAGMVPSQPSAERFGYAQPSPERFGYTPTSAPAQTARSAPASQPSPERFGYAAEIAAAQPSAERFGGITSTTPAARSMASTPTTGRLASQVTAANATPMSATGVLSAGTAAIPDLADFPSRTVSTVAMPASPMGILSMPNPAPVGSFSKFNPVPTNTPARVGLPPASIKTLPVTPTTPTVTNVATIAPVTTPVAQPRTVSVPAAPARRAAAISAPAPAPTPSFRAADVYSGLAPVGAQGVATGGNTVSRDKYGNISVGNQFGATTTTTPGGRQAADLSGFFGGGFGDFGAPGSLGGLGGRLGKAAPGIIGGMIGNAVAGPVGGILGAMLGNRVAANRAIGLDTYPDAPSPARGNRSSSTGKSRGELSDRARSDIDRGKGGLY